MVRIFYRQGNKVLKETDVRQLGQIPNIMWIDLQNPTLEDEEWVESKCGISIQTPAEIQEIETSSRYFERYNEITVNSTFLKLEDGNFTKHPVSFILKNNTLVTYRQSDLSTFADVNRKIKTNNENFTSCYDVMMMIQETRIDLDADMIERMSGEVTTFSRRLAEANPNSYTDLLIDITTLQENTMALRESMVDKQRVLSYLLKSVYFPEDKKGRLRIVIKDINSLIEHTTFTFERLEYLQNTITGLINIEQNKIIKRFTVFTIAFLPPTLISGIFGMNFGFIPMSEWSAGFFISIMLMFASTGSVLLIFKRKGWI
ncbi:MAG: magnesium/cobalt transporter CorA [Bacteroidia bacterium]